MHKLLIPLLAILMLVTSCRHSNAPIAEPMQVCGCMDPMALNNNPDATKCDPTQCKYAIDSVTGVYDVTDTYTTYTSMGPAVTTSNMQITVTRGSATTLLFDTLLKCTKCENGGIPYAAQRHSFYYTSYSDAYTSENGDGGFAGDAFHYSVKVVSSFSSLTPSHKGSGVKRR